MIHDAPASTFWLILWRLLVLGKACFFAEILLRSYWKRVDAQRVRTHGLLYGF